MDYPFVKCLHPVQVTHGKYTQLVPCGHCAACESSRKSDLQLRIQMEIEKHKHNWFITLTYDDEHLPLFRPVSTSASQFVDQEDILTDIWTSTSDDCDFEELRDLQYDSAHAFGRVAWVSNQARINTADSSTFNSLPISDLEDSDYVIYAKPDFDSVMGSCVYQPGSILGQLYEYHRYLGKCRENALSKGYSAHINSWYSQVRAPFNYVALLYYRDAQLFLKRLRKQISKFTDEKIRYYIIGEYGTRSLRPHWHVVLSTDSDTIATKFAECQTEVTALRNKDRQFYTNRILSACWQYGYSTIDKAEAGVGSYVASYVVGSNLLPSILARLAPQKTVHSIGYGIPHSKVQALSLIRERNFDEFTTFQYVDRNDGNRVKSRALWRSYYRQFFPTFTSLGDLPNDELFRVFKILPALQRYFQETSCEKIARGLHFLTRTLHSSKGYVGEFVYSDEDYAVVNFFDFIPLEQRLNPKCSAFRSVLYASKRFLAMADWLDIPYKDMFDIYLDFKSYLERKCLAQHYLNCIRDNIYCQDYYNIYGRALNDKEYLFDRYKYGVYFSYFERHTTQVASMRVKHRSIIEQIKNI